MPDIRAAAAIVFDPQTLRVLWEENSREERSIGAREARHDARAADRAVQQVRQFLERREPSGVAHSPAAAHHDFRVGARALVPGTLHAIRVTLIARTTSGLVGNAKVFSRPGAEDRPASVTLDAYRRRLMRSIVEIRNLAGSP